jgi:translation initiation factor eIF-2B subunit epsilon
MLVLVPCLTRVDGHVRCALVLLPALPADQCGEAQSADAAGQRAHAGLYPGVASVCGGGGGAPPGRLGARAVPTPAGTVRCAVRQPWPRADALVYPTQVFVFCCAHAAQIEAYLRKSRWLSQPSFAVHTIVSTDCLSVGEALRLVDQRNVVRSDFVLVSGDTVSNMSLAAVLAEHRARRQRDKLAILTMVTKKVSARHRAARMGEHTLTMAVDPETNQLLHYEEGAGSTSALALDASLFSEHRSVQVRTDLLDCHIDICAPEVLFLFTDNFDYQHMRRDFVCGTLMERELGNTIHVHQLGGEYAARVHNLRTYDAVARDIIQRWVYPFVPDANWLPRGGAPSYSYHRRNVYKEEGVVVARSAEIGADTVLGAGTTVGELSLIRKSVVGRGCRVGMRACLDGCHLMDNCVIGDHVRASGALICEGAIVNPGAVLEPGAVVSFNVVVGKGFTVPRNVRLSLFQQPLQAEGDTDDELEYASTSLAGSRHASAHDLAAGEQGDGGAAGDGAGLLDAAMLAALRAVKEGRPMPGSKSPWDDSHAGAGGAGYRWEPRDTDDEWRFSIAPMPPAAALEVDASGPGDGADSDDDGARAAHGKGGPAAPGSGKGAAGGMRPVPPVDAGAESSDEEDEVDSGELHFRREVAETFLRCVKDKFDPSNAVVELQGLKMAENRTFADLARYILTSLLGLSLPSPPDASPEFVVLYPAAPLVGHGALLASVRARLRTWAPLLRRFLKTEDDQVEMLLTFEEFAAEEDVFKGSGGAAFATTGAFAGTLHVLYDADVLTEEAALAWKEEKAGADEADKRFAKLAQPFFDWLANASTEEDDEEGGLSGDSSDD